MHRLRNILLRWMPAGWVAALKRRYYPRVVRNFDASRWPCAAAARGCVRPGDVVVDAGANIGYLSGLFSAWVGPSGSVHAFEPVPETFQLLVHNARVLRWTNVQLHPFALSDGNRAAVMAIPAYPEGGENLYESHLVDGNRGASAGERPVTVELRRLDDCLDIPAGRRISLVKIDVEGHEAAVIQGGLQLLERHHPALVIEIRGNPDEAGSSAHSVLRTLSGMGYEVFMPTPGGMRPRAVGEQGVDYVFLHRSPPADAGGGRNPPA